VEQAFVACKTEENAIYAMFPGLDADTYLKASQIMAALKVRLKTALVNS
jgi:hypothetical protein